MWYLLNYSLTLYVLAPCGPSVCSFLPFFFFFVFALTPATRRRRGRRMRREASMPADRPQLLVPRVPVRGTPLSSFFFFFYSSSNLLSPATSLLVSFLPSPPKPFFSPGVLARLCNVRRPCAGGHLTPRTGTLTSQHPPSRPPSVLLFFFFFLPPHSARNFLPCPRNCPPFSSSPPPALPPPLFFFFSSPLSFQNTFFPASETVPLSLTLPLPLSSSLFFFFFFFFHPSLSQSECILLCEKPAACDWNPSLPPSTFDVAAELYLSIEPPTHHHPIPHPGNIRHN